jgi:hypothetical protein
VLKGQDAIIVLKIFGATTENFSPGIPGARDLSTAVSSHLNLSGDYTNQPVSHSEIPHFAHNLYLTTVVSFPQQIAQISPIGFCNGNGFSLLGRYVPNIYNVVYVKFII